MRISDKFKENLQVGLGCLFALGIIPFFILFTGAVIELFNWLEPAIMFCLKILGLMILTGVVILVGYGVWKFIGSVMSEIEERPILSKIRNGVITLFLTIIIIFGLGAGCVRCADSFDDNYYEFNPDAEHLRPDQY